uniref:Putative ionotropic receptor ligand binding domain-containing protein n=1 Tax=Anopheles farauti TaxID=69004 RepID=A0A182QCJ6_9DIPT
MLLRFRIGIGAVFRPTHEARLAMQQQQQERRDHQNRLRNLRVRARAEEARRTRVEDRAIRRLADDLEEAERAADAAQLAEALRRRGSRVVATLTSELYDFSGYYTVLVVDPTERSLETAGAILRTLWTLYIVNVVVLLGPQTAGAGARLYTYFPYGEGYCEQALPVLWNVFEPDGGGFVHPQRELFPRKLSNLYTCPLAVATFPIFPFIIPRSERGPVRQVDGIEGFVLRTLRQRLNFRLQLVLVEPPDWGTAGPRDAATGAAAYIRHCRANLTIGYWATTLHRNRYMASSFAYYTSQLVLTVAPGPPYSSLELLRFPFNATIWLLLLATLTIACVALPRDWLGVLGVLFGGGLVRTPARHTTRTLLLVWLGSTLILRSAYTGFMFRFLQSGRNRTVPNSIPEVLDAGYALYMHRNYSFVFDAYPDAQRRARLVTAHQFRHTIIDELQQPGASLSVLLPLETVTFFNRNLTRHGQLLRIGSGVVYVAKLAIYTQRSSPLIGPLNNLLEMFVSSGLLHRWAAHYHQLQFLADPYRSRDRQQLLLTDMDGAFVILLAGLAVSFAAFVGELLLRCTSIRDALAPLRCRRRCLWSNTNGHAIMNH